MRGMAMPAVAAAMMAAAAPMAQGAPASGQSVQQLFDEASRAMGAGDNAAAIAALTALESRVANNARSLAIVRVRKGLTLAAQGKHQEAQDYLEKGLAALPADDPALAPDRIAAAERLGSYAMSDLDYAGAVRYYDRVLAEADAPVDRVRGHVARAQARIFVDPAAALADVEQAERIAGTELSLPKDQAAQIAQVKGRILLNLGRFAEAERVLGEAVKGQGGLSLKVDYHDLVARSDASIAAMLAGHEAKAREYLVYTGAGRLPEQDFTSGAEMPLPPCGLDGLQPEDRAVVEFGIGDDGSVRYASPVYGSRPGGMALLFAQAVRGWSWRAEDVQKIPGLFRMVTRLELRCSTSEDGPSIVRPASVALAQWLPDIDQAALAESRDGMGDGVQRQARVARFDALLARGGEDAPGLLALALEILCSPTVTRAEVARIVPLVQNTADRRAAPPLARLMIDRIVMRAESREERRRGDRFTLVESRYSADPVAHAVYRLLRYDALRPGLKARNAALLDGVIDDPALDAESPLKAAALIRRASLRAAANDMAGAQADFARTGLDAAQCSIVDARPALKSAPTSSADYPTAMLAVGIEGWTRVQFDVGADGRTLNQRAVVTYPPMIFGTNGEKILARARYEQSFRPGGHMGCGGSQQTVTFRKGY